METLGCEICFEDFDDSKVVPKMLDCGHTICGICINNMKKKDSPQCPKCRKPITRNKEYTTNYCLLSLIQPKKKAMHLNEETIKEEFSQIIEKLKKFQCLLTQKVKPQQKLSQVMEMCVNKLKGSEMDEETDVYSMASAVISDLAKKENTWKRNLEIVTQCLTLMEKQNDSEALRCGNCASSMKRVTKSKFQLSLGDFGDSSLYMKMIRKKLRDGVVYVAHPYEGKILYGKLRYDFFSLNGTWKLSVLEAVIVPNGAFVIELEDLKKGMSDAACKLQTFLEIRNQESGDGGIVVIDMGPSLPSYQFIMLCSGECGVSYINSYLGEPIEKDEYVVNICEIKKPFEKIPKGLNGYIVSHDFEFEQDEILVGFVECGHLSISRTVKCGMWNNLIGVARDNPHIKKMQEDGVGNSWKIEDCGIFFCPKNSV